MSREQSAAVEPCLSVSDPLLTNHFQTSLEIICICGGDGFPFGSATASRIVMIGKALQSAGSDFRLLHCGPSPTPVNTSRSGTHDGIPYEYTTTLKRPASKFLKFFVSAWAVIEMTRRLMLRRLSGHRPIVYLYVMHGPLNLYVAKLCRLLGFPLVQEMCEWWPGEPTCSKFSHWLYRRAIFSNPSGVIAISREIESRVKASAASVNPDLKLCYIPSLVDLGKFKFSASSDEGASVPRFVWCGTVDGWIHDVLFLVRAFAQVRERGYRCQLVVVGPYSPAVGAEILDHAVANGAPPEDVILRGWIDDAELSETYSSASALLLPLGDNDRSVTRMPNKLPEYLASARPVISAQIGAVSELLENGVNARLVSPGNENEFAEAMIEVLERPDWATYIGKRGRETGVAEFDYRSHVDDLAIFFERCSRRRNTSGATRVGLASLWQFARSLACSLAGLALIVSGVVRRARAQAFEEGVVTAVYFHSPKRRLFTQCVRWLQKYGYTFISEKELLAFLHEGQPVPRGAVWLSFDDGAAALMEDVLPLVRSEQLPITIFIPSGIVAGSGVFPWLVRGSDSGVAAGDLLVRHAMTVEELKQIEQRPEITIGSHTVTHAILPWCASSVIAEEVGESKRVLEDWLNKPVETFAYPNGQHDERSECLLAAAGYRLAATTESGFVSRKNDPWRIPRFSVADDIFFPEAICNLVGVWRPWIEAAKKLLRWEWRRAS